MERCAVVSKECGSTTSTMDLPARRQTSRLSDTQEDSQHRPTSLPALLAPYMLVPPRPVAVGSPPLFNDHMFQLCTRGEGLASFTYCIMKSGMMRWNTVPE